MKTSIATRNAVRYLATALTLCTMGPAWAGSVLFNASGSGSANAAAESFSVGGSGFIVNQYSTDYSQFSFSEVGAYQISSGYSIQSLSTPEITAVYTLYGSGSTSNGVVAFSGGRIDLYSDAGRDFGTSSGNTIVYGANNGTRIASFSVAAGGAAVGYEATLSAKAIDGTIASGYFFDASGRTDLATSGNLMLNIQVANAIDFAPSNAVVSEIVCKASGFTGNGCNGATYSNALPVYTVVADLGSASLVTAVPEPGEWAMLLTGLTTLGLIGRRKSAR